VARQDVFKHAVAKRSEGKGAGIKVLHAREAMKVENDIVAAIICIKLALNDFDHSVRVCHEDPFMLTGSAKTVTGKDTY
jgi:hypothetical protein